MMINMIAMIGSFMLMEAMAWFTHKYIMHGFLWNLHRDHHVPPSGFFQKNDLFFLVFAIPSICLIVAGIGSDLLFLAYAGCGIALYGLAYFLVHDVLIHQRFKLFRKTRNPYLIALRRAHKIHHRKVEKNGGECFGMLVVPFKYYREALKRKK